VSAVDVVFREARQEVSVEKVPLSHLSIEVGHLYREDMQGSNEKLRELFKQATPWVTTAIEAAGARHEGRARVSTCFLFDDYGPFDTRKTASPRDAVTMLAETAEAEGIPLDYVVRESGCVLSTDIPRAPDFDRVTLAEIVRGQLVAEPDEGDNGLRPPTSVSGWLSNGRRSPQQGNTAAMAQSAWGPPEERGRRRHSVFLDTELWTDPEESRVGEQTPVEREWSCAFLAAVWHLLRLGLLRNEGKAVAKAYLWNPEIEEWPDDWADMPTVIQLNRDAQPFAAYRAMSVLPHGYLETEHAARVILKHFNHDETVVEEAVARAEREGVVLPKSSVDRLSHVFIDSV
jgi:hypothetical protein